MDPTKLYKSLPGRKSQIDLLLALFGKKNDAVVPGIFVYGHTATGKSKVLQTVMQECELPHVIVNCIECYTTKLFYEHILNHLSKCVPGPENDYTNFSKCDNMNDFVRLFKQIVTERGLQDQTVYLVFDKAERMREIDINILPAVMRLQDLTGLNACSILVSEIVWEKFRCGTGLMEPFCIHFPDYSKSELVEVMSLDCPEGYSKHFYSTYVSLLLSVFHLACRSLSELRHLAQLNFPKYVEPIEKEEAAEEATRKLWRNIEPHLKKALDTVYLREVSSAQWERMQAESMEADELQPIAIPKGTASRNQVELPYYSKFLLIAAYLASYNPAKTDKRFFSKASSKTSRRSKLSSMKRNERTTNQLLGPKPFPLDRLMAIFYAIVESKVAPTANIFSQISSLVTLQLMTQVVSEDQLDAPKYKCLVSLDFVKTVARTVNFEVTSYLYDFV